MTPEDTPYGRLAELADPAGARFKILGPNLESA
jgi:predicted enzyme related to lactoylglutathione lyase